MKKNIPFALLSVLIQGALIGIFYYIYNQDFGYKSPHILTSDEAIDLFNNAVGIGGLLGLLCAYFGIMQAIYYQKWWGACLKIVLIYLPCLAVSVFWVYWWLFVLAYV